MKKATTIIKELDNLQKELYTHFTSKQIIKAIEEIEWKTLWDDGTGLISVIYEGCNIDIELNEFNSNNK